MDHYLIYGANGYTGTLIAREAAARGQKPVLAGRNAAALADLAGQLGLEHRVFALDDPARTAAGLAGMRVVLHCAGPFAHTARVMADARWVLDQRRPLFAFASRIHTSTRSRYR